MDEINVRSWRECMFRAFAIVIIVAFTIITLLGLGMLVSMSINIFFENAFGASFDIPLAIQGLVYSILISFITPSIIGKIEECINALQDSDNNKSNRTKILEDQKEHKRELIQRWEVIENQIKTIETSLNSASVEAKDLKGTHKSKSDEYYKLVSRELGINKNFFESLLKIINENSIKDLLKKRKNLFENLNKKLRKLEELDEQNKHKKFQIINYKVEDIVREIKDIDNKLSRKIQSSEKYLGYMENIESRITRLQGQQEQQEQEKHQPPRTSKGGDK